MVSSYKCLFDVFVGERLGAEKPIVAMDFAAVVCHALFGCAARTCSGNDDVVAWMPVGGQRYAEVIDSLEPDKYAFDFVKIPPQGKRVVDDGADDVGKVDEEHCPHCLRGAFAWLYHAVFVRHFHAHVIHQREEHLDIFHAVVFDAVFYGA